MPSFLSHTKPAVVIKPSPDPARTGMCPNVLFTYPLQKMSGFALNGRYRSDTANLTAAVSIPAAPTAYWTLAAVVYTSARGK